MLVIHRYCVLTLAQNEPSQHLLTSLPVSWSTRSSYIGAEAENGRVWGEMKRGQTPGDLRKTKL